MFFFFTDPSIHRIGDGLPAASATVAPGPADKSVRVLGLARQLWQQQQSFNDRAPAAAGAVLVSEGTTVPMERTAPARGIFPFLGSPTIEENVGWFEFVLFSAMIYVMPPQCHFFQDSVECAPSKKNTPKPPPQIKNP